ncbi:MAG: hypothetical protein JOZ99_15265 [Actinobacteria bacterium]|nr:hypothetical protein [Actinomycetota bacterium]
MSTATAERNEFGVCHPLREKWKEEADVDSVPRQERVDQKHDAGGDDDLLGHRQVVDLVHDRDLLDAGVGQRS